MLSIPKQEKHILRTPPPDSISSQAEAWRVFLAGNTQAFENARKQHQQMSQSWESELTPESFFLKTFYQTLKSEDTEVARAFANSASCTNTAEGDSTTTAASKTADLVHVASNFFKQPQPASTNSELRQHLSAVGLFKSTNAQQTDEEYVLNLFSSSLNVTLEKCIRFLPQHGDVDLSRSYQGGMISTEYISTPILKQVNPKVKRTCMHPAFTHMPDYAHKRFHFVHYVTYTPLVGRR